MLIIIELKPDLLAQKVVLLLTNNQHTITDTCCLPTNKLGEVLKCLSPFSEATPKIFINIIK